MDPSPDAPDHGGGRGRGSLLFVTGASAGLGRAILETAPTGAHRVDVSRSGPPQAADGHVAADLADPASWPEVSDALEALLRARAWGRVVVVHNAATILPIGFAGEVEAGAYTRHVMLNAAAPQVLGTLVLGLLRDVPGPRDLVLVTSGAARHPVPGWSAYCAAKAGVDHWVRTVGREQEQRGGVRVLAVAPGVVRTDMQEQIRASATEDFPDVARFRRLDESGALIEPLDAARALWDVLDDPAVRTGTVLDLRDR